MQVGNRFTLSYLRFSTQRRQTIFIITGISNGCFSALPFLFYLTVMNSLLYCICALRRSVGIRGSLERERRESSLLDRLRSPTTIAAARRGRFIDGDYNCSMSQHGCYTPRPCASGSRVNSKTSYGITCRVTAGTFSNECSARQCGVCGRCFRS